MSRSAGSWRRKLGSRQRHPARRLSRSGTRLLICTLLLSLPLAANELIVESRRIGVTDVLTFTVSLEGAFAARDAVNVPLQNLALVGAPSVSSEFSWINGRISRRKSFRYRARPLHAGPAQVGPVVLEARGNRRVLPAVTMHVVGERVTVSNQPEMILRDLETRGRPPLFVVAEADKSDAWVGEQIQITWSVYNAATIQQWQVVEAAQMPDFWVEEIETRSNQTESVWVGGRMMQRMTVRRVAAYPLRTGTFQIGGTTIEAAVLQGSRPGPFSIFEGRLVDVTHTSAPLTVHVKPLPEGPPVDAVGDLVLRCDAAKQQSGGPVVVPVTLAGTGNLRAAVAPRLEGNLAGELQIEGGEVVVNRGGDSVAMTRRWRYLMFPERSGMLEVPPLVLRVFDPVAGVRRELRCRSTLIDASSVDAPQAPSEDRPASGASLRRPGWPAVVGGLLLVAVAAVSLARVRRTVEQRRLVREITRNASPAEILTRLEADLGVPAAALMTEHSDRGDAWRALRSLLDAAERDRDIAVDSDREIVRRVRDVLAFRR